MKVLVTEHLSPAGIAMLGEDLDVDVRLGLTAGGLDEIIGDYNALVIRSATQVDAALLERAGNLKVVGRAGIGLDLSLIHI